MNADGYTHLILSGGGMQGISYIGVYRYLKQYKLMESVRHIVGCSIGALCTYLYALDFTVEELELFVLSFSQDPKITEFDLEGLLLMYDNNGLYSNERFKQILIDAFYKRYHIKIESISFQEFSKMTGKNIYITAYQLSSLTQKVFSNIHTPYVDVFTAVLASMAIPFLFQPVIIDKEYYIDNGICNSLPIDCLTYKSTDKVLALYLTMAKELTCDTFKNPINYFIRVLHAIVFSNATEVYLKIHEEIDNIDIIHFKENPLPFIPVEYIDTKLKISLSTELYNEGLYYGYNTIYQYLKNKKSKGSLSQTS
jgi:NTE family protein